MDVVLVLFIGLLSGAAQLLVTGFVDRKASDVLGQVAGQKNEEIQYRPLVERSSPRAGHSEGMRWPRKPSMVATALTTVTSAAIKCHRLEEGQLLQPILTGSATPEEQKSSPVRLTNRTQDTDLRSTHSTQRNDRKLVMGHGNADIDKITPQSTFYDSGRFGRLFPTLPPFSADTPLIRDALDDLGAPGGMMDAQDDLSDPVALLTRPELSANNPDNSAMTAGMTFLGQFLDHDMTFDPTSSLARQQDPESLRNFRIPALDLDNVYGGGPDVSPHLYDQSPERGRGRTTLLREEIPESGDVSCGGTVRYDLPRNSQKVALIGDSRNDENLIVSQLHLAMLSFHNAVVADVESELGSDYTPEEIFTEAQRVVRWHYHWMILHEYLPQTIGPDLTDDILQNGRQFYHWRNNPYIPVEFSVAAFRFGHSQIRPSYRANFGPDANDPAQHFVGLIFDPADPAPDDPGDLRGGCRAAKRFIDWQTFFDFSDGRVRNNKIIDTKLSSVLFDLMGMPSGTSRSLAQRNLLRGLVMKLPSGQRVAAAMQATPLAETDLDELKPLHLHKRTPLWYYILKEAETAADGQHLGPVGGRIVGEVIHGLIEGASQSYLTLDPDWTPSYGTNNDFRMVDLLTKAGVVADLH